MFSPREIAEAFSRHRFDEAYEHLAPDIVWVLVGGDRIEGRETVISLCKETLTGLADTTTEFERFLVIADETAAAVDVVARYVDADGSATTVSSCDLYEFDQGLVTTITSYTVEVP